MAHFAAAVVVSGMASAAGATGVVAAAGFDRRGRARGPGGGEAGGPPGVKPPVKLRCARARPSTLMSVVCNVSIFPRSRREVHLYTHQGSGAAGGRAIARLGRENPAGLPERLTFPVGYRRRQCRRLSGRSVARPLRLVGRRRSARTWRTSGGPGRRRRPRRRRPSRRGRVPPLRGALVVHVVGARVGPPSHHGPREAMLGSASLCLSIGPHLTRRALVSQDAGVLGGVPDVLGQVVEPIFLRTGRLGPRAEDATQSVTHRLLECQEAVVLALPPRIARRRGARLPSAARPACGVLRVVSPRSAPKAVSWTWRGAPGCRRGLASSYFVRRGWLLEYCTDRRLLRHSSRASALLGLVCYPL